MQTKPARPLLLGFVLRHLLVTVDELAATEDRLEQFADSNGYTLAAIYIEESVTTLAVFKALIEAVNLSQETSVVLPSLLHFQVLDTSTDIKGTFERATGARVLVAVGTNTRN